MGGFAPCQVQVRKVMSFLVFVAGKKNGEEAMNHAGAEGPTASKLTAGWGVLDISVTWVMKNHSSVPASSADLRMPASLAYVEPEDGKMRTAVYTPLSSTPSVG